MRDKERQGSPSDSTIKRTADRSSSLPSHCLALSRLSPSLARCSFFETTQNSPKLPPETWTSTVKGWHSALSIHCSGPGMPDRIDQGLGRTTHKDVLHRGQRPHSYFTSILLLHVKCTLPDHVLWDKLHPVTQSLMRSDPAWPTAVVSSPRSDCECAMSFHRT